MGKNNKFFIPRGDRRLGDRYELLECLGDGSHGSVWRAQRLSDDNIVAVKIPKDQGGTSKELAEGSALIGQESHPNVVSVYWMGRVPPENEWYAIEMEYFPSLTLAQLLDNGDQGFVASYDRVLGLYQQVLSGVGHLHKLGVSHGDIKPQNILVSGTLLKLTDFGCSISPEDIYARTRENGGTILYSAPEVVVPSTQKPDLEALFQADIYSLGVLLYHLATTRLPHDTRSQVARYAPFPRPREITSSVCPALEEFILKCLALNPEDRWPNIEDMSLAFRRVRQAQIDYHPIRILPPKKAPTEDWSSQVMRLMEEEAYRQAENVALAEFEVSKDPQAFLLLITAAFKDGRYFDCINEIETHPEILFKESSIAQQAKHIALSAYIETHQVHKAENLVDECINDEGKTASLLLKKASILGAQARYEDAGKILLELNREYPRRPAILKRLVLVFEQLRDPGKASAFLKAYTKEVPSDNWAQRKLEQFVALGVR